MARHYSYHYCAFVCCTCACDADFHIKNAFWALVTVNNWCWTIFVLAMGMRYLDFPHRWLQYGQDAIVPFFVVHQPVIIVIAFFVVQWYACLPVKLAVIVLASFAVSLVNYELLIKRVAPLRIMFGMKTG